MLIDWQVVMLVNELSEIINIAAGRQKSGDARKGQAHCNCAFYKGPSVHRAFFKLADQFLQVAHFLLLKCCKIKFVSLSLQGKHFLCHLFFCS